MTKKFAASDEFIVWAQSLSGMMTKIKTQYGSIADMVENSSWDEGKTPIALSLVKSLHRHVREIDKELSRHVSEKLGKDH
jgi:hypothetical protein